MHMLCLMLKQGAQNLPGWLSRAVRHGWRLKMLRTCVRELPLVTFVCPNDSHVTPNRSYLPCWLACVAACVLLECNRQPMIIKAMQCEMESG